MSFKKLEKANEDIVTCSDLSLKVDNSNLVSKALGLMRNRTGISQYFQVHLEKHIPIQAGLGGGSGNAATTMYAFNRLCGYPGAIYYWL
jgi:4-diphosphocytidyl-2-C-methyl-D-erythritol kinase